MSLPDPSSGCWAVVTGASQGIGAALADRLGSRGYRLVLAARRAAVLNEVADGVRGRHGVEVITRAVDLAQPAQRAEFVADLAAREVGILCANAGVATFGPISELDPAAERAQVELNVQGVHDLTLAVLPGMVARRAGGILVSGSAAGNLPIPNNATYAATKAFANIFCESLRGEVREAGVHVTLLAPGPVRTEIPAPAESSIVDRLVPDALWLSSDRAAELALAGLARNKVRVVPGAVSKIMSGAGRFVPRTVTGPAAGGFYRRLGG